MCAYVDVRVRLRRSGPRAGLTEPARRRWQGLVGVAMVQALSSVRAFRLVLKTYVDVESKMTYAERVFEYAHHALDCAAEPCAAGGSLASFLTAVAHVEGQ